MPLFLSGMLGCEGKGEAEAGGSAPLVRACTDETFAPTGEKGRRKFLAHGNVLIPEPANCMQNQAVAGLQTCSKGRGSGAESQIGHPEKLHSFLCC